jgi:signal transduction histidine kinase
MEAAEFQRCYAILPEPMLLVSSAGEVRAGNRAACEVLGRTNLTGLTLSELVEEPESKVQRFLTICRRSGELLPGAFTLCSSDGTRMSCRAEGATVCGSILLRFHPRNTATDRFIELNERIEALNREIAERQRAEAALRRANAALQQFAYSASHDLKEPLRMVGVYSQMLQRRYHGKLDPEADEYLSFTVLGAKRMDMLVADLLAYTEAVAFTDDDVQTPVNTEMVLSDALANLTGSIRENNARITVQNLPPALRVKDVHLLQLFQNVIGNAIKYRGESPPEIRVSAHQESAMWRICVHDNGIGIPPEYAQQVFGIFKRLHSGDKFSGTGIGLAICQKIVDRYGGRIWVESEGNGRGSTFCFTLPGE